MSECSSGRDFQSLKGTEENPYVFNFEGRMGDIPYVFWDVLVNQKFLCMVDTGAQISIIKSNVVPENCKVLEERIFISGIGGGVF